MWEPSLSESTPLCTYDAWFHDRNHNARTALTTAFFCEQNLTFLLERIGEETGQFFGRPVIVVPDEGFFGYLEQLVRSVYNLADVGLALAALNAQVINHEVPIQYASILKRQLYHKWFLFEDRPRTFERPRDTFGRHRRDRPSAANVALADPKSRFYQDWLRSQTET